MLTTLNISLPAIPDTQRTLSLCGFRHGGYFQLSYRFFFKCWSLDISRCPVCVTFERLVMSCSLPLTSLSNATTCSKRPGMLLTRFLKELCIHWQFTNHGHRRHQNSQWPSDSYPIAPSVSRVCAGTFHSMQASMNVQVT